MAGELLAELKATGSYLTSLKGTALYTPALGSRLERLKALIDETNIDACSAAQVITTIRSIDMPTVAKDSLMGSAHERMLNPVQVDSNHRSKQQDFTSIANFLTPEMWANEEDFCEDLCQFAVKLSLNWLSEDTAAVLTSLVAAQAKGLEGALGMKFQPMKDLLDNIKRKVKKYAVSAATPCSMKILPATPDALLLRYPQMYHHVYTAGNGPVPNPLDKNRFETLCSKVPRRKSHAGLRGECDGILSVRAPDCKGPDMMAAALGHIMQVFSQGGFMRDGPGFMREETLPGLSFNRRALGDAQSRPTDGRQSGPTDGRQSGPPLGDHPSSRPTDGRQSGPPLGGMSPSMDAENIEPASVNGQTDREGLDFGTVIDLPIQPAKKKDAMKRMSVNEATAVLMHGIKKGKKGKYEPIEELDDSEDESPLGPKVKAARKSSKTKNKKTHAVGKGGGKGKGKSGGKGGGKGGCSYRLCDEPTRNQTRVRCSNGTSWSIPYSSNGNSRTKTLRAAKAWIASHQG
jgi:hypothetical protein